MPAPRAQPNAAGCWLPLVVLSLVVGRGPAFAALPGDCNGNGQLAVNELVIGVSIALGSAPLSACAAFDTGGDGQVGIAELIAALDAALGLVTQPAATATATETPTAAIPTPTSSASATGTTTTTPAASFRLVADAVQAGTRLALRMPGWLALLDATLDGALPAGGVATCDVDGSADVSCQVEATESVQRITYRQCANAASGGHIVTRTGELTLRVAGTQYCASGVLGSGAVLELDISQYRQIERDGQGDSVLDLSATLTTERALGASSGCAGPAVSERISGVIDVDCAAAATSVACPAGLRVPLHIELDQVTREITSGGFPCERQMIVSGHVSTAADEAATLELSALRIRTRREVGGETRLAIDGRLRAECLGDVVVATMAEAPLEIPVGTICPVAGELSLARESPSPAGNSVRGEGEETVVSHLSDVVAAGARGSDDTGLRQRLYRAAGGSVYQVIQNSGSDAELGADAVQLTTLVGALDDSVGACANVAGASAPPQAVTGAAGGAAVPIGSVVRSALVGDAGPPCFNRNAEGGSGRLCLGPACSSDCSCAAGAACVLFTRSAGVPLASASADVPAGREVDLPPLAPPCSGFAGRAAYAFGSAGPTLEPAQCAPLPGDGVLLEPAEEFPAGTPGATLIVAYTAEPLQVFNGGAAGFPVDLDGANAVGCPGAGRVLTLGRALLDSAPAPRVTFTDAGTVYDYDFDTVGDKLLADCTVGAPLECNGPPPPTPDPSRPCSAIVLAPDGRVRIDGSTAGGDDGLGEGSCGWGGGSGAPEVVYEYTAPAAGVYDIRVRDAGFDAYLYVRGDSCVAGNPELGCNDDLVDGSGADAGVTLTLGVGQRIAIVVDGAAQDGGAFTLSVDRRQADLVVRAITAPAQAVVGDQVEVAAEVENAGDGVAGPFSVELAWARDATLADRLGSGVARCAISGLAPGERALCRPLSRLTVPLVAAGNYVIGARADDGAAVSEENENNNGAAVASAIAVLGADLDEELYRARDGTLYQLVSAVPRALPSAVDRYRVTTLAGAGDGVTACATLSGPAGSLTRAVAGATVLASLAGVQRTALLRPNDSTQILFDAGRGGRLTLGGGSGAVQICARPETCAEPQAGGPPGPAASLQAAVESGGGLPAACVAAEVPGASCDSGPVPAVIGFSAQSGGVCELATAITVETQICATEPSDGFALRAGESVVFVYAPGRDAFEIGVAGFGMAASAENPAGCARGRVLEARALGARDDGRPLLARVGTQSEPQLAALDTLAVSPDGRHLYAANRDGALAVFRRDPGGAIELLEVQRNVGGQDTLIETVDLAISPDGATLYVAIENGAIATFQRDAQSGRLSFVQLRRDGVGGVSGLAALSAITVSPDGAHVYTTGAWGTVAFRRDAGSGSLSFLSSQPGLEGRAIALSPDGAHAYVANGDGLVLLLARDRASGQLSVMAAEVVPGLGSNDMALAISGDGRSVYVVGTLEPGKLAVFARDEGDGHLSLVHMLAGDADERFKQFEAGVDVAADGGHVYVLVSNRRLGGFFDAGVAVFGRDPGTGAVTLIEVEPAGAVGERPRAVAMTGDGQSVYVASSIAFTLGGQPPTGRLSAYARDVTNGTLDLVGEFTSETLVSPVVAVGPEGAHVYAAFGNQDVLQAFSRDRTRGTLTPAALLRQGEAGADGLVRAESLAIATDAVYVFSGSRNTLAAYAREPGSGALAFAQVLHFGEALRIAASPDGRQVYVLTCERSGPIENPVLSGMLTVNDRRAGEVALEVRQTVLDAVSCDSAITVSPDGRHVYVGLNGAVQIFSRASTDGHLEAMGPRRDQVFPLAFSPDGAFGYGLGSAPSGLTVLAREALSGGLSFIESGASVEGVPQIEVSPDGRLLYLLVTGLLVNDGTLDVYFRDPQSGRLTPAQRIDGVVQFALSPDAAHAYLVRGGNGAVDLFAIAD